MACAPANMMSTNKFRVTQVTLVHINFSAACIDEQKTLIQLTSLLTLVKQYILYIWYKVSYTQMRIFIFL